MGERQGNVLLLVSSLGFGGAEKHIVTLANRLDTVGFRVALCYLKPIEGLLSQLEVAHLTALSCLQVRRRLDWTAIRTLTELIDRSDIDVVVCANTYPALYAWLAGRRVRRPPKLVEIFHTTTCHGIKEKLQMLLYRRIFRRFDALVYVSSNQRAYWAARGLGARRDLVIHNGIDTDLFRDATAARRSWRSGHDSASGRRTSSWASARHCAPRRRTVTCCMRSGSCAGAGRRRPALS